MSRNYHSILNVLSPSFTNTYSLAFDGVDDYVDTGAVDLGETNTISFWFKNNSANTGNGVIGDADNHVVYFQTVNLFYYPVGSTTGRKTFGGTNIANAMADTTNWHNLILIRKAPTNGTNGYNDLVCYLDGNLEGTHTNVYTANINLIPVYIGKSGLVSSNTYDGLIDEVSYYDNDQTANVSTISTSPVVDLTSLNPTLWLRNGDNGSYKSPQWLIPENSNKDKVSNYSFDFDGVDDSINCGDSDTFSFGNGSTDSPFSISAWIKPSSMGTTFHILNKENNTTTGDEYVFYITNTNILRFAVCDQNFIADRQGRITSALTASEIDNVWCHVVATYDGRGGNTASNGINIYVNGVNRTSGTFNAGSYTAMHNTSSDVKIGSYSSGVFANGNIDETAIFSSELTSENVTSIYNSGTPTTLPVTPIAHYKLGEEATFSTNWTVPDAVGSNTGTSANMTIEDRVGNAPNSTSNALSYNMTESDRETDVPS